MKVIALKKFSSRIQKGDSFDVPERDARTLIAAGAARSADDTAEAKPKSRRSGNSYRTRHMTARDEK